MWKEDPLKLYKIKFATEFIKRPMHERLAQNNDFFSRKLIHFIIHFIYRKNKSPENDKVLRKFPGQVPLVRALSLLMCNEDPLKLYKIKFATDLFKWFLNGRLVNMMFSSKLT
jgi:hypothetical protein